MGWGLRKTRISLLPLNSLGMITPRTSEAEDAESADLASLAVALVISKDTGPVYSDPATKSTSTLREISKGSKFFWYQNGS